MSRPEPDAPRVKFRWSRYHAMMIAVPADHGVRDRLLACIGALVGIAATGLLVRSLIGTNVELPLLVAPMGAAAVLLFAVPASPLAQPYAALVGNIVSAVVGVAAARMIPCGRRRRSRRDRGDDGFTVPASAGRCDCPHGGVRRGGGQVGRI